MRGRPPPSSKTQVGGGGVPPWHLSQCKQPFHAGHLYTRDGREACCDKEACISGWWDAKEEYRGLKAAAGGAYMAAKGGVARGRNE